MWCEILNLQLQSTNKKKVFIVKLKKWGIIWHLPLMFTLHAENHIGGWHLLWVIDCQGCQRPTIPLSTICAENFKKRARTMNIKSDDMATMPAIARCITHIHFPPHNILFHSSKSQKSYDSLVRSSLKVQWTQVFYNSKGDRGSSESSLEQTIRF